MKKRSIVILGILTMLVVMLAGCGGRSMSFSWSAMGESHSIGDKSVSISAKSVNGHASRNVTFTAEELAALQVKNTNSEGKVSLVLSQGDIEKTFDVSDTFDESIDTSAFEAGKLNIRINFENAKGVDVYVSWG